MKIVAKRSRPGDDAGSLGGSSVAAPVPSVRWLPPGKTAAVCFSVDDVHPASSAGAYDAGGDLGAGALGRLDALLRLHPRLKATVFATPDWRLRHVVGRRPLLSRIPGLGRRLYWTSLHPKGRMRLDRHPLLVAYLNGLCNVEVALHGLHHAHPGPRIATEFQQQSPERCAEMLAQGLRIFEAAGLRHVRGFAPPAWNLPPALVQALAAGSFDFVTSARDLRSEIRPGVVARDSGLQGVSLIHPQRIAAGLLHFPSNFQATSSAHRAHRIIDCGGLLSIKAHIFKDGGGHTMADGLDDLYCNYLSLLLEDLDRRYGDALWWTTFAEIASRVDRASLGTPATGERMPPCTQAGA